MFKRIFSLSLGLGVGLLVGGYVVKRLDEASRAVAPTNLAQQAGRAAGGATERLRVAVGQAREAMAATETELRSEYHVPSLRETLGG